MLWPAFVAFDFDRRHSSHLCRHRLIWSASDHAQVGGARFVRLGAPSFPVLYCVEIEPIPERKLLLREAEWVWCFFEVARTNRIRLRAEWVSILIDVPPAPAA